MFFVLLWVGVACDKELSRAEVDMLVQKTDSITKQDSDYQLSQSVSVLSEQKLRKFRNENKAIAVYCAKNFIEKNVSDGVVRETMFDELYSNLDSCSLDNDIEEHYDKMLDIYSQNGWFNDLMLYLCDVYTDAQFMKSRFFSNIKDSSAYKRFLYNTEKIAIYGNTLNTASKQRSKIYTRTLNRCMSEYKQLKKS